MTAEAREPEVITTSFPIARADWARFGDVARSNGRSKAAELRMLVRRALDEFEASERAA